MTDPHPHGRFSYQPNTPKRIKSVNPSKRMAESQRPCLTLCNRFGQAIKMAVSSSNTGNSQKRISAHQSGKGCRSRVLRNPIGFHSFSTATGSHNRMRESRASDNNLFLMCVEFFILTSIFLYDVAFGFKYRGWEGWAWGDGMGPGRGVKAARGAKVEIPIGPYGVNRVDFGSARGADSVPPKKFGFVWKTIFRCCW